MKHVKLRFALMAVVPASLVGCAGAADVREEDDGLEDPPVLVDVEKAAPAPEAASAPAAASAPDSVQAASEEAAHELARRVRAKVRASGASGGHHERLSSAPR